MINSPSKAPNNTIQLSEAVESLKAVIAQLEQESPITAPAPNLKGQIVRSLSALGDSLEESSKTPDLITSGELDDIQGMIRRFDEHPTLCSSLFTYLLRLETSLGVFDRRAKLKKRLLPNRITQPEQRI
jgi:exonuclease VII small subunit